MRFDCRRNRAPRQSWLVGGHFRRYSLTLSARVALLALLACGAWLVVARPTRRASASGLLLISALVPIKAAIGFIDGPQGWVGRYTVVDRVPARVAPFFWRFDEHPFRIDWRLALGWNGFQFDFLNDNEGTAHGLYKPSRIEELPIDMEWSTWLLARQTERLLIDVTPRRRWTWSSTPVEWKAVRTGLSGGRAQH